MIFLILLFSQLISIKEEYLFELDVQLQSLCKRKRKKTNHFLKFCFSLFLHYFYYSIYLLNAVHKKPSIGIVASGWGTTGAPGKTTRGF